MTKIQIDLPPSFLQPLEELAEKFGLTVERYIVEIILANFCSDSETEVLESSSNETFAPRPSEGLQEVLTLMGKARNDDCRLSFSSLALLWAFFSVPHCDAALRLARPDSKGLASTIFDTLVRDSQHWYTLVPGKVVMDTVWHSESERIIFQKAHDLASGANEISTLTVLMAILSEPTCLGGRFSESIGVTKDFLG